VVFDHSNVGYVSLAEIVTRIGGVPLDDLARRRIFDPLGMTGSRLGGPPAARHSGLPAPPGTVGDGGWWTTAADLLR
jgi:CubicO group peptidase (beta-lactamase class C family)